MKIEVRRAAPGVSLAQGHARAQNESASCRLKAAFRFFVERCLQAAAFSLPGVRSVRTLFLALSLLACSLFPLSAQNTNAPKPTLHENRFLFIIETSRAMKSRADGVNKVMEDLIASGVGGQLRRGDSIAVWTYNSDLYVGRLALQQWTPEIEKAVAVRILGFLKDQTYEKSAALQKSLLAMQTVIKNSEFITIILISDGSQPVAGTPFDSQINNLYKSWDKEQQKARMPFVTVLQATKGKITHFTVTSAPWPVEMPPLPKELLFAATNSPPKTDTKTNAPPTVAARKPPIGQPLIISGKKPPAPEPPRTNETTVATPIQPSPGTNPAAAKMEIQAPAPAIPNNLAAGGTNPSIQTPAPVAEIPKTQPQALSSPAAPAGSQAPASASTPTTPSSLPAASPAPGSDPSQGTVQSTTTLKSNSAAPVVVANSEISGNAPGSGTSKGDSGIAAIKSAHPTQSVVVSEQPLLAGKLIWGAGLAFGLFALIVVMLKTRRSRSSAAATSLITRSFEKERKP